MKKYYDITNKQLLIDTIHSMKTLIRDSVKSLVRGRKGTIINPDNSYYPEEEHKSYISIFWDQVVHIFQYGEINKFYYFLGLDVKGEDCSQYISERWNLDNLRHQNRKRSGLSFNHSYMVTVMDKFIFAEIMGANGFPIPNSFGLLLKGELFVEGDLKTPVPMSTLLEKPRHLLCKPVTGRSGKGIIAIKVEDGQLFIKNKPVEMDEFKSMVSKGKYLVQSYIENQHPAMKALFPNSINTLRVTMVRTKQGIEVLGCMCLMGASNAEYSNWHYGGICVYVDEEGRLGKYGFSFSEKRITKHPDTGVVFEGYQIPYFKEMIQLCEQAMNLFYGMKTIGWDMAFTEDGPIFIEGNNGWGIIAHQMVEHRGWAEKYKRVFNLK